MAVSDPTAGVPTPTGVLQGAAVFSWDGSTWQPSARASVGVGTPTGVLRGVAPFSWSGSAWTPAGGGPEVASTGGVLDGVAVYTWSGSAWVPAGGGPDVPTPTGTLQGVAAFYWDGTAWQPSGQAGPDVATPAGVLQGMAMFNVTAGGAVPAGTLDLNFMTPGVLDSRITFSRTSTATYFDATGTMQTAATNVPRWDYNPSTLVLQGLLIEDQRTNLTLQSANIAAAPWTVLSQLGSPPVVTANQMTAPDGTLTAARLVYPAVASAGYCAAMYQGVAVTAVAYTFSIWLRGNAGGEQLYVYISDGASAYPARQRVTLTTAWQKFAVTATLTAATWYAEFGTDLRDAGQSSTSAQTIYAWGAQLEAGATASSYIPTVGATATRAYDSCYIAPANMSPWFVSPGGSWAAEFIDLDEITNRSPRVIGIHAATGITPLWVSTGETLCTYDGTTVATINTLTAGVVSKGASTWGAGTGQVCLNGGTGVSGAMTTGFATLATSGIGLLGGNPGVLNESMFGYLRRVRYWSRVLSSAELQQVTT